MGRLRQSNDEYEEVRITKYVRVNNKKLRISYIPCSYKETLSIKINYAIDYAIPLINEIIELKKYKRLKLYSRINFSDREIEELLSALELRNYTIGMTASENSSMVNS